MDEAASVSYEPALAIDLALEFFQFHSLDIVKIQVFGYRTERRLVLENNHFTISHGCYREEFQEIWQRVEFVIGG